MGARLRWVLGRRRGLAILSLMPGSAQLPTFGWPNGLELLLEMASLIAAGLEQIDVVHRLDELYPDTFELARTADDVERVHRSGKIASLIGMEGGHSIRSSIRSPFFASLTRRARST
jgi:microsomal dipeptidase-like Zn-dependent dipeptidase